MTKKELVEKGKDLGITLSMSMLKGDMEHEIAKAEKNQLKAKSSSTTRRGEY